MASLSGFPFRLTPLMAKTLSPMWMAPVLQSEGGAGLQDYTRQVASLLTQTQTMRLLVTEDGDTVVVCLKLENKELHRDDGVCRCCLSI